MWKIGNGPDWGKCVTGDESMLLKGVFFYLPSVCPSLCLLPILMQAALLSLIPPNQNLCSTMLRVRRNRAKWPWDETCEITKSNKSFLLKLLCKVFCHNDKR